MLPVGITIEDFIVADMEVFDDFKPTCPEKAKLQRWWSLPPHIEDGRGCGRGDGAQASAIYRAQEGLRKAWVRD